MSFAMTHCNIYRFTHVNLLFSHWINYFNSLSLHIGMYLPILLFVLYMRVIRALHLADLNGIILATQTLSQPLRRVFNIYT